MTEYIRIDGQQWPVTHAELHVPRDGTTRHLYLMVGAGDDQVMSLWGIELPLLQDIADLPSHVLHVFHDGTAADDDTLGTDVFGVEDVTDLHGVRYGDEVLLWGEILVRFIVIDDRTIRCRIECTLSDADEIRSKLSRDDFRIPGEAEFFFVPDESDPFGPDID